MMQEVMCLGNDRSATAEVTFDLDFKRWAGICKKIVGRAFQLEAKMGAEMMGEEQEHKGFGGPCGGREPRHRVSKHRPQE